MATIRTAIELEDRLSGVLSNVINTVQMTVSAIEKMNGNLDKPIEAAYFDGIRDNIADTSVDLQNLSDKMERVREKAEEPIASVPAVAQPAAVPVQWQTDSLNVFTNTGIERFRQEAQAATRQLNDLGYTQSVIVENARNARIFSPDAVADISGLQGRIQAIRGYIRQIESKPLDLVSAAEANELERLRMQLESIRGAQLELNSAVEAMDVSEANRAYLQLSQTVGSTERYIRDNVEAQESFNQKIEGGISGSDRLMQSIKGIAAAYISVQSLGKALNLSDELTQTTARLNMMNDGQRTTAELQEMIFQSAQRSRGAYQETADAVAKLGLMADSAFGSSAEVVAFMEQVNKQFRIAGTGADGVRAAMLQLTQAMGSGVLRGEEFNSIFEQAPTIMQSIADYLEVPIGKLRDMAAEGEITAGVVKAAMFAAADETNARFESMPMTFEQVWTSFENQALMAFQPVLEKLNDIANSDEFQKFADNIANALIDTANAAMKLINIFANNFPKIGKMFQIVVKALNLILVVSTPLADMAFEIAEAIIDNWSIVEVIILAVAAAIFVAMAAQHGLNAAFLSCPIFWIIAAFIILTAVVDKIARSFDNTSDSMVAAMNDTTAAIDDTASSIDDMGTSISTLDQKYRNLTSGAAYVCGAIGGVAAFVFNILGGVSNFFLDTGMGIYNFFADIINDAADILTDFTGGTARAFFRFADSVMSLLQSIASAFDHVFGSNLSDTWQTYRDDLQEYVDKTYGIGTEFIKKYTEEDLNQWRAKRIDPQDWFNEAAKFGAKISEAFNGAGVDLGAYGFDYDLDVSNLLNEIKEDTGSMADSLSVTDEELKYLRDIAERETINRFTTAEINFDMSGMQNTVNNDNDIDGIITKVTDAMTEVVFITTEGVHT